MEHAKLRFVHTLATLSGFNWFVRTFLRRHAVSIVMYHDPSPETLRQHFEFFQANGYSFLTLEALVAAIEKRDFSDIPSKAVVVTIDDGHKGNRDILEVCAEFGVAPTIYLTTGLVGTHRRLWANYVSERGKRCDPDYTRLPFRRCKNELWEQFAFALEQEFPDAPETMLRLEDLEAMHHAVDFQAHTRFHPSLPSCLDEDCVEEIASSKQSVESMFRKRCDHFAYPFGHHGDREVQLLRRLGFRSGRTTLRGWNFAHTDPYRLRIVDVSDRTPSAYLPTAMCNAYSRVAKALQRPKRLGTSAASFAASVAARVMALRQIQAPPRSK